MKAKSIILGFLKAMGVFGILGFFTGIFSYLMRYSEIMLGIVIAFLFLVFIVLWAAFASESD